MTDSSRSGYTGPGIYRHYKGDEYKVIGLAVDEADRETVRVVYVPVENAEHFWTRALDDFNGQVPQPRGWWGGPGLKDPTVPRFVRVGVTDD